MSKLQFSADTIETTNNKITSSGGGALNDSAYPSLKSLIDMIYPVGSVCIRGDTTDPSTVFVGTQWTRIKGRFIYGIDDGETLGITGGEATHTLTVDEMPSHNHYQKKYWGWKEEGTDVLAYNAAAELSVSASWQYSAKVDTTFDTGGNQPHNNMPPYKGYYIWERVS